MPAKSASMPPSVQGMKGHLSMLMSSLSNANMAIQRLTEMMGEHRTRLNAVMATLPEGMLLLNASGQIVMENTLAHTFFEELAEHEGERIAYLPAQMLLHLKEQGLSCVTHTVEHGTWEYTLTLKIFHPQSPIERYALYIAKKEMAPAQRTQSLSLFMTDLIAALAHEINNPLTPILALTSPAMRCDETSEADMDVVHHAGERIANIMRQMMLLETVLKTQAEEHTAIDELCGHSIEQWAADHPDQPISFVSSSPTLHCHIHSAGLQQLLQFLISSLSNLKGPVQHCIQIKLQGFGSGLAISLCDTGEWPEQLLETGQQDTGERSDFFHLLAETLARHMGLELIYLKSEAGLNGYMLFIPEARVAA